MSLQRSLKERFFHALGFEALALAICAPAAAWLLGVQLVQMGTLTVAISLIAMVWNMVFNAMFDRLQSLWRFERDFRARAVHAVLFEGGLIVATVPLAAWWLDIGLWQAFVLDIGLVLFFLPYTMAYNWAYDQTRAVIVASISRKGISAATTSNQAKRTETPCTG